jgi:16S rRNA processing protein RimM
VAERICVAQIGAAHGIRGEVKLKPFTGDPMAVAHYGVLESEDGKRTFEIETIRPAKDFLVVRFKGVVDRSAAEQLRNLSLYVSRERLPAPQPDEFYHADLIGLTAVTVDGAEVGTVVGVHDFGAGDLLEIRMPDKRDTVMLPFTAETVPVVDIAGGRIVIEPPQGLFKV